MSRAGESRERRGRLIVVDGIDGGGKTTQLDTIEHVLRGYGIVPLRVRDPGTTAIGTSLRSILLSSDMAMHRRTEALLFMAARSEMMAEIVAPALHRGETVLCDRYLLSTVVYQSIGGDVSTDELWSIGRWSVGNIDPSWTLLLDLPVDVAIQRIGPQTDRMESRGRDYLSKVRQSYLDQLPHCGGIQTVIDAGEEIAAVTKSVERAVGEFLD